MAANLQFFDAELACDSYYLNELRNDSQVLRMRSEDPATEVIFTNLKEYYEKAQVRSHRHSRQRVNDATIHIVVVTDAQIHDTKVFVERVPEAAKLCGDFVGRIELVHKSEGIILNRQYFTVDLDSVYSTSNGSPVYQLSRVDSERRNKFRLVVVLIYIDGTQSSPHYSQPFVLKTQKKYTDKRHSTDVTGTVNEGRRASC